ncbi:hypothetical protein CCH79_00015783, partial [Gambusia affinis]
MNIPLSSILFVIFSINFSGWLLLPVGSSHMCPHQCICYEHADLVDCRNGKFEHVPRGLPHGTWLLKLGGNNLSIIETRNFIGLWSLRVLVLTNCHIKEIQAQVGRNRWKKKDGGLCESASQFFPRLFFLFLSAITTAATTVTRTVMVMTRTVAVSATQSWLSTQAREAPTSCGGSLQVLQLSNNNISQIDSDALAPLYSLAILNLEGNNLHHLKFKTFISLHTTATHIQLS